jgi:hypothetical protein
MTEEIAVYEADNAAMLEKILVGGDFSSLTPAERLQYVSEVCRVAKLNPLTRPILWVTLKGKLVPYATKDCTDQLRNRDNISTSLTSKEKIGDDVYVVTALATLPNGRTEESTGAVSIAGLKGDDLANALMKAETKAKRRATLSISGLGMLDETEIETIPDARPIRPEGKVLPAEASPEQEPFDLSPEPEERPGEIPTEERQQLMATYNALYVKATAQGIKIQRVASNCPLSQLKGAIAFLERKVG